MGIDIRERNNQSRRTRLIVKRGGIKGKEGGAGKRPSERQTHEEVDPRPQFSQAQGRSARTPPPQPSGADPQDRGDHGDVGCGVEAAKRELNR